MKNAQLLIRSSNYFYVNIWVELDNLGQSHINFFD